MSKRIPKSLSDKLADLDAHLFLLQEALSGIEQNESAFLKTIAAELRVLVCRSSGTEGLLWRLAEELNVSDEIDLHLAGNVNRSHPLAKGLRFAFNEIARVGTAAALLPPAGRHSLKRVIKEVEAVFVAGAGLTHENLIKGVSQQFGSAHEDEGVAPALVELGSILMNGVQPFVPILKTDAELSIEIGERVLSEASRLRLFDRPERSRTLTRAAVAGRPVLPLPTGPVSAQTSSEGTIEFWTTHPNPNWMSDGATYEFPPLVAGTLTVFRTKVSDGSLRLRILNVLGRTVSVETSIPPGRYSDATFVVVTWHDPEVNVYLNGQLVHTDSGPAEESLTQR